MTPQEVLAVAMLGLDAVPVPGSPEAVPFLKMIEVANPLFDGIRHLGWYLVTPAQQRHIWTEHRGRDIGAVNPFGCFGCASLFDGIGEYDP